MVVGTKRANLAHRLPGRMSFAQDCAGLEAAIAPLVQQSCFVQSLLLKGRKEPVVLSAEGWEH